MKTEFTLSGDPKSPVILGDLQYPLANEPGQPMTDHVFVVALWEGAAYRIKGTSVLLSPGEYEVEKTASDSLSIENKETSQRYFFGVMDGNLWSGTWSL